MTEHVHPSKNPGGGGHFLMGMCRWNRVAHFGIFGVRKFLIFTVGKHIRIFVLQVKSKVFFIQFILKMG